ncbi:MAG: hypothetical protein NVS3B19_16990 [Ginsengibacter sp.]
MINSAGLLSPDVIFPEIFPNGDWQKPEQAKKDARIIKEVNFVIIIFLFALKRPRCKIRWRLESQLMMSGK